jgi:hypothetical protein
MSHGGHEEPGPCPAPQSPPALPGGTQSVTAGSEQEDDVRDAHRDGKGRCGGC